MGCVWGGKVGVIHPPDICFSVYMYVCKRISVPLPTEMELTHGGECRIDHWKLIFSLRR